MSSRFIGSGSYSVVRRENLSGRPVAVKCVSESSLSTSRELKVLTSVKHKNVISFLGARQRDDGKLDIILPLADCDLSRFMQNPSVPMPISRIRHLARQLLEGVNAMHEAGFVHRDLKPANLLISHDIEFMDKYSELADKAASQDSTGPDSGDTIDQTAEPAAALSPKDNPQVPSKASSSASHTSSADIQFTSTADTANTATIAPEPTQPPSNPISYLSVPSGGYSSRTTYAKSSLFHEAHAGSDASGSSGMLGFSGNPMSTNVAVVTRTIQGFPSESQQTAGVGKSQVFGRGHSHPAMRSFQPPVLLVLSDFGLAVHHNEGQLASMAKRIRMMEEQKHKSVGPVVESSTNGPGSTALLGPLTRCPLSTASTALASNSTFPTTISAGGTGGGGGSSTGSNHSTPEVFFSRTSPLFTGVPDSASLNPPSLDLGPPSALSVEAKRSVSAPRSKAPVDIVTLWYRSPELMLGEVHPSVTRSKAVDAWSVGCVIGEMLCRQPLFRGMEATGKIRKQQHVEEEITRYKDQTAETKLPGPSFPKTSAPAPFRPAESSFFAPKIAFAPINLAPLAKAPPLPNPTSTTPATTPLLTPATTPSITPATTPLAQTPREGPLRLTFKRQTTSQWSATSEGSTASVDSQTADAISSRSNMTFAPLNMTVAGVSKHVLAKNHHSNSQLILDTLSGSRKRPERSASFHVTRTPSLSETYGPAIALPATSASAGTSPTAARVSDTTSPMQSRFIGALTSSADITAAPSTNQSSSTASTSSIKFRLFSNAAKAPESTLESTSVAQVEPVAFASTTSADTAPPASALGAPKETQAVRLVPEEPKKEANEESSRVKLTVPNVQRDQLRAIFSVLSVPDDSTWPGVESLPYSDALMPWRGEWSGFPSVSIIREHIIKLAASSSNPKYSAVYEAGLFSNSGNPGAKSPFFRSNQRNTLHPLHISPKDEKLLIAEAFETCIDLVQRLLHFDPQQRLTVQEALQHPFFTLPYFQEYFDADLKADPEAAQKQEDCEGQETSNPIVAESSN